MKLGQPIFAAGLTLALGMIAQAQDKQDVPHVVDEARVATQGKGELTFKAPEKGQVWLYDLAARKPLNSMSIRPGDRYRAVPAEDRVYYNDNPGAGVDLTDDRIYQIYFVTDEARDKEHAPAQLASANIPNTAAPVAEGRGDDLSYKPDLAGTVYLYDASEHKLVNTFQLEASQRLTVAPANNAVSLDGKRIAEDMTLNRNHNYTMLFDISQTALIPDDAKVVAEGADRDLSYKADQAGTLYFWNASNDRLLTTFNVQPGQRLTVSPANNAVALDQRRLDVDIQLDRKSQYKLLFHAARQ